MNTIHDQMTRILAFDIGIKNLAWCCLEFKDSKYVILGWDNYNLLSESSNVATTKQTCRACSARGVYDGAGTLYCARHCPVSCPPLRDLSGQLLKKIPKLDICKQLLTAKGVTKIPVKKDQIHAALATHYSLPVQSQKVSKAPDVGLTEIHDSLKNLVAQKSELWSTCSQILLENQPAFKNPTMKSVQILLFATLRCNLPTVPPLRLVHAGKKVKGAATGDAGYKDRKAGSEARAASFLEANGTAEWKQHYSKAAKKSDLADALAMCLDALPSA